MSHSPKWLHRNTTTQSLASSKAAQRRGHNLARSHRWAEALRRTERRLRRMEQRLA